MEQTFMTIHNLTHDCNILFASESIFEILGYQPEEVRGKSCFDFFHPDEIPFARSIHKRGVLLDKAAVLHYVRILSRDGRWVSCECCFTIVHDVMVACTSIYHRGEKSERRAFEAPQIRRIFSSSPRDPRYHMLEHLSPKFKMPPMEREPRAALILNRFTRNLTIMFATNAVASILGLPPDQLKDKSFYRCIQENCLSEALRCLESAKANDSIAYLRFWSRDPREEEDFDDEGPEDAFDDEGQASGSTSDSEGGGVQLANEMDVDMNDVGVPGIKTERDLPMNSGPPTSMRSAPNPYFGAGSGALPGTLDYETPATPHSSSTTTAVEDGMSPRTRRRLRRVPIPSMEIEAVVSCTSDGLVVVLRKARPPIPPTQLPLLPWDFESGLCAAPWGQQPIRPYVPPEMLYTFRPPLLPQHMPLREEVKAAGGPPLDQMMRSIRDVAVFAWALIGINGTLAQYSRGQALDEAVPPDGLPVWDRTAVNAACQPPENQAARRWARMDKGKAVRPPPSLMSYAAAPSPRSLSAPQGYDQDVPYGLDNFSYGSQSAYGAERRSFDYAVVGGDEQHCLRRLDSQPQRDAFPSPPYRVFPSESWVDARQSPAGSPLQSPSSFAIPTSQAQSHGRGGRDCGYGWP